jgi:hypothetical protein
MFAFFHLFSSKILGIWQNSMDSMDYELLWVQQQTLAWWWEPLLRFNKKVVDALVQAMRQRHSGPVFGNQFFFGHEMFGMMCELPQEESIYIYIYII